MGTPNKDSTIKDDITGYINSLTKVWPLKLRHAIDVQAIISVLESIATSTDTEDVTKAALKGINAAQNQKTKDLLSRLQNSSDSDKNLLKTWFVGEKTRSITKKLLERTSFTNFKKHIQKQLNILRKNKGGSTLDTALSQIKALAFFGWKNTDGTLAATLLANFYRRKVSAKLRGSSGRDFSNLFKWLDTKALSQQKKYADLAKHEGNEQPTKSLIAKIQEWITHEYSADSYIHSPLLAFLMEEKNTSLFKEAITKEYETPFNEAIEKYLSSRQIRNDTLSDENLLICKHLLERKQHRGLSSYLLARHYKEKGDIKQYSKFLQLASKEYHPKAMYELAIILHLKNSGFEHIETTSISLFVNIMASNDTHTKAKVVNFIENANKKGLKKDFYNLLRTDPRPEIQETLGLMYLNGGVFSYSAYGSKTDTNLAKTDKNERDGVRFLKKAAATQGEAAWILAAHYEKAHDHLQKYQAAIQAANLKNPHAESWLQQRTSDKQKNIIWQTILSSVKNALYEAPPQSNFSAQFIAATICKNEWLATATENALHKGFAEKLITSYNEGTLQLTDDRILPEYFFFQALYTSHDAYINYSPTLFDKDIFREADPALLLMKTILSTPSKKIALLNDYISEESKLAIYVDNFFEKINDGRIIISPRTYKIMSDFLHVDVNNAYTNQKQTSSSSSSAQVNELKKALEDALSEKYQSPHLKNIVTTLPDVLKKLGEKKDSSSFIAALKQNATMRLALSLDMLSSQPTLKETVEAFVKDESTTSLEKKDMLDSYLNKQADNLDRIFSTYKDVAKDLAKGAHDHQTAAATKIQHAWHLFKKQPDNKEEQTRNKPENKPFKR